MCPRAAINKVRRLIELNQLLQLKPRTTRELANRFEVPVRTVQRDLETLREAGEGIEEISRGVYVIPAAPSALNAVEALAMHAAARLLYHHAPTRNTFYLSALEKLASSLPEPARSVTLQSSEDLGHRLQDDRSLEFVARAWFERRVLTFEYRSSGGSGKWRKKELEVYFVEISRANLAPYVIGFERSYHRAVLTWKLSRMRYTNLLTDRYTIPETFDPKTYLTNAWGIIGTSGNETVTVRLRFAPDAAYRLYEGGYPNLKIEDTLRDGSLMVSVQVGSDSQSFPLELLSWVQSWGARVEVLEPQVLRERWLKEARQVAAKGNDTK